MSNTTDERKCLTGFERQFVWFLCFVVIQRTYYKCAGLPHWLQLLYCVVCRRGSRPRVWSILWAWPSRVGRRRSRAILCTVWVLRWWFLPAGCNVLIIIPLIIQLLSLLPASQTQGTFIYLTRINIFAILMAIYSCFSGLTLLVGRQEEYGYSSWRPTNSIKALKQSVKNEGWGADMVICLEWGANDLHMIQLMPVPPVISCFFKI